jgi:pimeloyl-ACP methyl ester carboxylesterase
MKRLFAAIVAGLLSPMMFQPSASAGALTARLVNQPGVDNWAIWGDGQKHRIVRDETVAGKTAVRIDVAGPRQNVWDITAHADITQDIAAGDTVTAAFWARADKESDTARAQAHVTAVIHSNDAPYPTIGLAQIDIGSDWKLYFVSGKAVEAFAARHSGVSLQLAGARQVVEIGPLFVVRNDTRKTAALRRAFLTLPIPTVVEDVVVHNRAANIDLAATFRAPSGKGPFPAVLLVTGHGPQSRGGFQVLSNVLVQHGIATLEYDKRGCGESTGTFSTATLPDLIGDAAAMAAYLKTRREVDPRRVGLLGASEGTLIVPAIAAKDPSYVFVILLGAVAQPMEELALDQWETANRIQGMSEDKIAAERPVMKRLYDAVMGARNDEEALTVAKAILAPFVADKTITQEQSDQFAATLADHPTREGLAFDPQGNLRQVKVPILAINGSLDLQVPASKNFPLLRQATTNNPDVTTLEAPSLNHNLQKAKTGTVDEWSKLGPAFSDQPTNELIARWLLQHLQPPAGNDNKE